MSLNTRIEQFLATVHSAENMASARDKLAEATELLKEFSPMHIVAAETARASARIAVRRILNQMVADGVISEEEAAACFKPAAKITANRRRKA